MDLLSQLQKFGNVKAGLPPAFSQIMPSTLAITGSVLTNAGVGGLILRAYTEIGRLPYSASILPDAFGGKPLATTLINSVAFNLASFSGQNSNYSLRISGYIQCSVSNNYIFKAISDDAVRLFIDETRIIDSWTFAGGIPVTSTGSCFMCAGQYYPILIEHSATGGSQQLTVQSSSDGITFKTLTHAIDGSNFSMAFDSSEFGGVRAGSLRVGGKTIFNGSIAAQATRKALLLANPPYLGTIAALSSNLAGPFAIAFWVKHTASNNIQTFVSFGGNRHIQINQFNQLIIAPSNGAAPSVSSTILATNVPNHVSCFLNSSNQFALYVNGTLDSAYNGSYTASTLPAITSDSLAIGGISSSTAATSSNLANVNTVIADLSIWNVAAFGTIDALKIYNSGRRYDVSSDVSLDNTSLPNLYLSYGFDTDDGKTRFTDSSPWHRNLVFSSGSTVSVVPAIIVNSDALSVIPNKIHTLNNVAIGSPNTLAPLTVVGSSNSLYNGALVVVKSIGSNANSAISVSAGVNASIPGGNSFIVFDQKDISGWSFGQDVSDAAKLKICNNSSFLTSSPYLTIDTSGRVGIGLSSPAFNLDIAGNINFSGSLYQGGAAYISSQWTTSGSNIFFGSSAANVGINTPNPSVSLDVVGSGRFTGSLSVAALTGTLINSTNILASKIGLGVAGVGQMLDVKGNSSWGQARFIPQVDNYEAALSFYRYSNLSQAAAGDTWILGHAAAGAAPGSFGLGCYGANGTVSAINIANTGFVGVAGKLNPAFALDVLGNINFSGNLFQGGVQYVGSQWTSAGTNLFYNSGAVGIGLSNPAFTLDVSGSSRISGSLTTNLVAASNLNVFGTISGTSLSLSGTFTTSGIIANNVYGSLLGRFYDESGVYNNIGSLTPGSPLPSPFITRPLIDNQLSLITFNNATIGSLSANYSLRIAGYIQPPATGTYLFRVTGQEGYSLNIAGQKLVNKWTYSGSVTSVIGTLTMYSRMWVSDLC